jgi:FRG domain
LLPAEEAQNMATWYETRNCRNWDDFLQKVNDLPKSGFYRGQSNNDHLMSSFERAYLASRHATRKRWLFEAAIIREFKRRAHHYVADTPEKRDLLEWLALMRHYNAPTRLVDFTYSHYIAAYFAFSSFERKSRAVWAIDSRWLDEESIRRCSEVLGLTPAKIDLHDAKQFTRCFTDRNWKPNLSRCFVAPVNAERLNTRSTIQQGFFLCPGDIEQSFEKNLRGMVGDDSPQKRIVKFVIPHSARNEALTELKHMNISRATLFPDLGGLAESLNDHFEFLFKDYHISEEALRRVVNWCDETAE